MGRGQVEDALAIAQRLLQLGDLLQGTGEIRVLAIGLRLAGQLADQNLRRNAAYEQTLIVALASEDEAAPETLTNYGFSDAFKKPFDIALLAEKIRTIVEERRDNM
jgi:DNA-binding response OmpR family regulator